MTAALVIAALAAGGIVTTDTGDAIVNARVLVTSAGRPTRLLVTDANGRFVFDPADGTCTVTATKPGYLRRDITAPCASDALDFRLQRAVVISGRVVDRFGDPIVSARVVAEEPPSRPAATKTIGSADTDDAGEFRIAGLPAGRFAVAVFASAAMTTPRTDVNVVTFGYRAVKLYYPGVDSDERAEIVEVAQGTERPGVDIIVGENLIGGVPITISAALNRVPRSDQQATGIIRGRATATDGRPLSRAQVTLTAIAPVPFRALRADQDGRFEFTEVPAGKYRVAAAKAGYAPLKSSDLVLAGFPLMGAGPSVELGDGERRDDVEIQLGRLGTIGGTVYDEIGEPLQGVTLQLLQIRYERGRRRLVAAASPRQSDDRGRYRIFDVDPGQYVVSASLGIIMAGSASPDMPGYARSYFPGASDPRSAQLVPIATSQEVLGVDFTLAPAQTAAVRGRIFNAAGEPTTAGLLQLRPLPESGTTNGVPVGARILFDGNFEFPNVSPGQYLIYADHGRSNPSTEGDFAVMPVTVNGADVTDLQIQMSPGSSIAGHIRFEAYEGTKMPASSAIEVSPVPVDFDFAPSSVANASIHADWTFDMKGVSGTRRLEATRLPPDWMLKEVRVNGIDATDRPLTFGGSNQSLSDVEVVLTDRVTEIAGMLTADRERPAAGAVIIFSTARDQRYPGSRYVCRVVAGADGSFRVTALPEGSYYVAVETRPLLAGEDAWQDPAYLESLAPAATTVTLGTNRRQSVTLKQSPR